MSPLSGAGVALAVGLMVGGVVGWNVEGWRTAASVATTKAEAADERRVASDNARTAEADQRVIEFHRLEANANVSYQTRTALDAAAAAARNRDATIAGLRNVIAAADAKADSSKAGIDPDPLTGADDPGTLREVVGDCTAEYAAMATQAIRAGIKVTGLQGYAAFLRTESFESVRD